MDVSGQQDTGAGAGLDRSTQSGPLHLDISTLHSKEVFAAPRRVYKTRALAAPGLFWTKVLTLEVSTPQGPELHLDGCAPLEAWSPC
jgi:hypothetical protein